VAKKRFSGVFRTARSFKTKRHYRKAVVNIRTHGVLFNEAATVFASNLSFTFPDVAHSDDEERYLTIDMSMAERILVVVYTDRGEKI
jgi:hypothetical protein